jgi:hypothetical protein
MISPAIEAAESMADRVAAAAAPAVQFVAQIPTIFDRAERAAETDSEPLAFGPSRSFGFVVPDMYAAHCAAGCASLTPVQGTKSSRAKRLWNSRMKKWRKLLPAPSKRLCHSSPLLSKAPPPSPCPSATFSFPSDRYPPPEAPCASVQPARRSPLAPRPAAAVLVAALALKPRVAVCRSMGSSRRAETFAPLPSPLPLPPLSPHSIYPPSPPPVPLPFLW